LLSYFLDSPVAAPVPVQRLTRHGVFLTGNGLLSRPAGGTMGISDVIHPEKGMI